MVKAVVVHTPGGPESMVLEDVSVGDPGPGQVRVRNRAIGLNFIDTYFRAGAYKAETPFVLGNEAAGEIVAIGPNVTGFAVGDRIGYTSTLGCYAQERVLDTKFAVKLPDAISFETAAGMMLKGLTAQYLLRRTFVVKAGDTILVHAAAGGVGQILCQWGNALGATVIGTAGSREKAEIAKAAGAHHVILYSEENFVDRVKEITGGKLCDVVYDGVGKATFGGSLDCIRPLGLFVSYGSASGQIDAFNIGLLMQKGSLFATRPTLYTYIAKREDLDAMAAELFEVVASGKVKIAVSHVFALADVVEAHRLLESRGTTGSTVLIP
ncbi:MAG: quinone oxidoreductase [Beijerinckiaceae bacterium]|nr:quinone oxidoreductase [Beijerinckiaceae bacterium]